ncbi:MAG: type II toxin-antitoxin system RelE/ParE family toxin [Desulfobacteraceae bacterium]|nr:type II toxin-antitoxin system RelE/ParE family toxin [Desulfobacteraceae bacterium]
MHGTEYKLWCKTFAEVLNIRELIEKPYRIMYRIKSDGIDVLAVIHGAKLLPKEIGNLH